MGQRSLSNQGVLFCLNQSSTKTTKICPERDRMWALFRQFLAFCDTSFIPRIKSSCKTEGGIRKLCSSPPCESGTGYSRENALRLLFLYFKSCKQNALCQQHNPDLQIMHCSWLHCQRMGWWSREQQRGGKLLPFGFLGGSQAPPRGLKVVSASGIKSPFASRGFFRGEQTGRVAEPRSSPKRWEQLVKGLMNFPLFVLSVQDGWRCLHKAGGASRRRVATPLCLPARMRLSGSPGKTTQSLAVMGL